MRPEPTAIEVASIEAAIVLWRDYLWPHAQGALRQVSLNDEHADERRILNWLIATGTSEVSREDIRARALSRRCDAEATQKLINRLVKAGYLRPRTIATGGRSARRWEVNRMSAQTPLGKPFRSFRKYREGSPELPFPRQFRNERKGF